MSDFAHFFDSASTTQCHPDAAELVRRYATESYGHPSSTHALGQAAARAIREARTYFAEIFQVPAEQVIFTSGGTESDNLAVYGCALPRIASANPGPLRALCSATEHPAVKKTVNSLKDFRIDAQLVKVDREGQLDREQLRELLPTGFFLSVHQVNNITGATLPVEELAREAKRQVPDLLFHSDAVQSFGKIRVPMAGSPVDLVSISSHKVHGPKGVGALIVLNGKLLKSDRFRPLLWGGEQESGWRSGTQNAGLIAGFHFAAEHTLRNMARNREHARELRTRLREQLIEKGLSKIMHWNSPENAIPQIVSLSAEGYAAGPLARLLEERGFLVATGSACSSKKPEPDPTLLAMGLPQTLCTSALRISFSETNRLEHVDALVAALSQSLDHMKRLGMGDRA